MPVSDDGHGRSPFAHPTKFCLLCTLFNCRSNRSPVNIWFSAIFLVLLLLKVISAASVGFTSRCNTKDEVPIVWRVIQHGSSSVRFELMG
jgi:hypothetical protein